MRRIFALLLCASLAIPATAFAADELLVSFEGFDYEDPDLNAAVFGDAGDGYNALGIVQSAHALLALDMVNNQHTMQLLPLTSTGFVDFGPFRFISYSPGRVRIYEDPIAGGTAADFNGSAFADDDCGAGAPPPNDTAPSTFTDGTLILGGAVTGFVISWDFSAGTGSFSGTVTFDEGTKLGSIPPGAASYTFSGLTEGPATCVPEGYDHQLSGEIRIDRQTSTKDTSWGRMKALYR